MLKAEIAPKSYLLGGSWVVISGVISSVTIVITQIRALIAPLTTTHELPSKEQKVLAALEPLSGDG